MTWRALGLVSLLAVSAFISAAHATGETLPRSDRELAREALRQLFPEPPKEPGTNPKTPPPGRPASAEDILWGDEFGLPSCDGELFCAIRFGEDIVVGGSFTQIGGVEASNIARWDGARWHPLSLGVEGVVMSLVVYEGALYVGGRFYRADGKPAYNLAKWDGQWSAVLNSTYPFYCCSDPNALSVFRGELIASGFAYTQNGYGYALAAWNGSTWRWLTTPIEGRILSMQAVGDSLYVAGQFYRAGDVPVDGIALWNGSAWSAVGDIAGDPYGSSRITSLATFHGKLYAAGLFDSIGGQHIEGIAAWDGSTWSSLQDREVYGVSAMAVCNDTLNVSTYGETLRWDGSTWSSSLPGLHGYVRQLYVDDRNLIAVGGGGLAHDENGLPRGFDISRWDGTSWHDYEPWDAHMKGLSSQGRSAWIRALAPFQDNLVAAGQVDYFGTGTGWASATPVMRWDGISWAPMAFTPWISGDVRSLTERSDTLYAAGFFYSGGNSSAAARWTGGQWTVMDTLGLQGVQLLNYAGRLILGTAPYFYEARVSGVYEWNGSTWAPLGLIGTQDQGIVSMVVHQGELVVAGPFTSIGGILAQGAAAWNGQGWRPLSFGFPSFAVPNITGLASYNGRLFASGNFYDGYYGNPLAEWNGTSWIPLTSVAGYGRHVNTVGGRLLLSGDLLLRSTSERPSALLWDGRTWRSLGSGTRGDVYASAEYRGSLYVGGSFSRAGDKSSFGVARWNGLSSAPARAPALSSGRPNPFSGAADFSYDLGRDSNVLVSVHDAQGRMVVILDAGLQPAGTHLVHWDGRDRLGKKVSAGIYFVSIKDHTGTISSRKIVRLR